MQLEDQCVSLELAKKLKELGFDQHCIFFWHTSPFKPGLQVLSHAINVGDIHECAMSNEFAAYTVAELLNMMPKSIIGDEGMKFDLNIYSSKSLGWELAYWWDEDSRHSSGMHFPTFGDKSLAKILAGMLIYLKEHELI